MDSHLSPLCHPPAGKSPWVHSSLPLKQADEQTLCRVLLQQICPARDSQHRQTDQGYEVLGQE